MKIFGFLLGISLALSSARAASITPSVRLKIDGLHDLSRLPFARAEVTASRLCLVGPIGQPSYVECNPEKIPASIENDSVLAPSVNMRFDPTRTEFAIRITVFGGYAKDNVVYSTLVYSDNLKGVTTITSDQIVSRDFKLAYLHFAAQQISVRLTGKRGSIERIPQGFYSAFQISFPGTATFLDGVGSLETVAGRVQIRELESIAVVPNAVLLQPELTIFANDGIHDYRYYKSEPQLTKDSGRALHFPRFLVFQDS